MFNRLTTDIFKVITFSKEYNPEEFDQFGVQLGRTVFNWICRKHVHNIKYYVCTDELIDFVGDSYQELRQLTKYDIQFFDNVDEWDNFVNSKKVDTEGPGFDIQKRMEISWNDNYLYIGSDATYYVLIEKL